MCVSVGLVFFNNRLTATGIRQVVRIWWGWHFSALIIIYPLKKLSNLNFIVVHMHYCYTFFSRALKMCYITRIQRLKLLCNWKGPWIHKLLTVQSFLWFLCYALRLWTFSHYFHFLVNMLLYTFYVLNKKHENKT